MGKRGSPCTVCEHKSRHQIEIGLVHGMSSTLLASRFNLSHDAISRHSRNHLTPAMRAGILAAQKPSAIDLDELRTSETEGLLSQLVVQRARLQSHVELAASLGDVKGAVAAEGAITTNLTLVAKLLGQLVQHHDVRHTSILISADYLKLRATLLATLRPFPDAARAVGAALHALESEAATGIAATAPARRRDKAAITIEHDATHHVLPPPPC